MPMELKSLLASPVMESPSDWYPNLRNDKFLYPVVLRTSVLVFYYNISQ